MPARRLPDWIRRPIRTDAEYGRVQGVLREFRLHTVCRSARCPNRHECWSRGTATFLILGGVCSRSCRFCGVPRGRPDPLDPGEPWRVAEAAARMGLRHVVVTSVTRDDLPDGGASVFARTVSALRSRRPGATVEVLTPDFRGDEASIDCVLDAGPDVFNHNLETVRRLQSGLRPQADYDVSLSVLLRAAGRAGGPAVKSGLMLGLGESRAETAEALRDLLGAGCRRLTLGQYLAPSRSAPPVSRFLEPEEFESLAGQARDMGFEEVAAGPLVRSSYRAERMLDRAAARGPRAREMVACVSDTRLSARRRS